MDRYAYAKVIGMMVLSMFAQWLVSGVNDDVIGACSSCATLGSYRVMRHLAQTGASVPPCVLWVVFVDMWQQRGKRRREV